MHWGPVYLYLHIPRPLLHAWGTSLPYTYTVLPLSNRFGISLLYSYKHLPLSGGLGTSLVWPVYSILTYTSTTLTCIGDQSTLHLHLLTTFYQMEWGQVLSDHSTCTYILHCHSYMHWGTTLLYTYTYLPLSDGLWTSLLYTYILLPLWDRLGTSLVWTYIYSINIDNWDLQTEASSVHVYYILW